MAERGSTLERGAHARLAETTLGAGARALPAHMAVDTGTMGHSSASQELRQGLKGLQGARQWGLNEAWARGSRARTHVYEPSRSLKTVDPTRVHNIESRAVTLAK